MKISEIIYKHEYIFSEAEENAEFDNITIDIKKITESSVLIIPNSAKYQSPPFLKILPKIIITDKPELFPRDIPKIKVENPRICMANAFYRFYEIDESKLSTFAITGTNGKTSTATFVKEIMTAYGKKVGFIGTGKIEIGAEVLSDDFYSMTTPDPDVLYLSIKKMIDLGCEVLVIEASSHALALDKLAPLKFDYGIFTNFSPEHGDFHKTQDSYYEAKTRLFKKCKKAFFNIDDEYCTKAMKSSEAKMNSSVGVIYKGDIYATHIENKGANGVSYLYRGDGFLFKMNLKIPGIYNVYNSMLAAAVCIDAGCPPCIAKEALSKLDKIPGRFDIKKTDITVIRDYAHTEYAFECFLREAKSMTVSGKLHVVFGCGGERDLQKRPRMAKLSEKYADKITVTSDNPRNENPDKIFDEIIGGFEYSDYKVIKDRKNAIENAILSAEAGDSIAIIGKGAEKYIIDNEGYRPFDEAEIIEAALAKREKAYAH